MTITWATVGGSSPIAYLTITLTNNQTSAVASGTQILITINSGTNSTSIQSALLNLNWQDGAGNILPSWLESGEANTSTSSVYWVKLNSSIAANGGTSLIYQCIYVTTVNCFNTTNTGAEPNFSGNTSGYATYDDGTAVFGFYDNFAGTSLATSWTKVANTSGISVSNGLTLTSNAQVRNSYVVNPETQVYDSDYYASATCGEYDGNVALGGSGSWSGTTAYTVCYGENANDYQLVATNNGGSNWYLEGSSPYLGAGSTSTFQIISLWITTNGLYATNNYNNTSYSTYGSCSGTSGFSASTALQIWHWAKSGVTLHYQWDRVRTMPPLATMPAYSVSALQGLLSLTGYCRDPAGNILPNCTVLLFKVSNNGLVGSTTSSTSGSYTFSNMLISGANYYVVAFLPANTDSSSVTSYYNVDIMGVTDNNLQGS